MKKLKIYLDTSIISFVFAEDSPEKQRITQEFFERYLDKYDVYISNLVLTEIENTSDISLREKLKNTVTKYRLNVIRIAEEDEMALFDLSRRYVEEGVIPERKFDDAMHIAISVYYDLDILLSWNFRHLANINKQIHVNIVNKKEGYLKELFLLNPMEVLYEDEE